MYLCNFLFHFSLHVLIFLVVSNALVLIAVIKDKMRSARNIFIFNLAFSDLILALSLPFTIKVKLTKTFPFSESEISCR